MIRRTSRDQPIMHSMLGGLTPSKFEHQGEIIVIGLGRFGGALATTLVEMGHEVMGIDSDEERVHAHADVLTVAAQADSTSERTLRELGVDGAHTAVVCIGTDIESSVLTASTLVDLGIRNIWAKAITAQHGRILERVGVHQVVFPEAEMGSRVAHLVTGKLLEYVALDDDFVIVETMVPHRYVGMELGATNMRADHRVTVVCVKPAGGSFRYADRDTVLGENDLVAIAGHRADVARFAERQ